MKNLIAFALALISFVPISFSQTYYLDTYIGNPVVVTEIGGPAHQVNQPRDLDFKPGSNELWVVNHGTGAGGSMVIFYNAGQPNQSNEYRIDSHSGHFMIYPSAIAAGDDGYWACVSEIKSTGGSSSTFMGPALWTGDTSVFARVFQSNWVAGLPLGSHLDMLHQSPFAMGIAHDSATAYWVADGHNGNICKYDFGSHHGPGYEDHSDGKIWRYEEVSFTRIPQVPSHMILDKASGWLYFVDGGPKKIKRLNINSGTIAGNLQPPNSGWEQLSGYWEVENATVEDLATLTTQPSGIDYYNNRLVVSDYTTGDIYLYSTDSGFTLLETIVTGLPGMMGIKIGPDGRIWCVNNTENKVYRLDVSPPSTDVAITSIISPLVQNFFPSFYSTNFNVCDNNISPQVEIKNTGTNTITSVELEYLIDGANAVAYLWTGTLASNNSINVTLPSSTVLNGSHLLEVRALTVNGSSDNVELNNLLMGSFRATGPAVNLPFSEEFDAITFPPDGWNYIHYNPNNEMTRVTTGGFGASTGSLKMNNYTGQENISGQKDYFMSPVINMSTSSINSLLTFNIAYAKRAANTNDTLRVLASSDCGNTWDIIYDFSGSALSTAPNTLAAFTPTATQWRTDTVFLAAYAGEPGVIFMFAFTSNFGNNIYIDDISFSDFITGIESVHSVNPIELYPNPTSGIINIILKNRGADAIGNIYSAEGKLVRNFKITENETIINLSEYRTGIYSVSIITNTNIITKRVIKH